GRADDHVEAVPFSEFSHYGSSSKPLEAIRQLWSILSLVGELRHKQREWLRVPRDPQPPTIHGIEASVANQLNSYIFGALIVAATHQAWSHLFALGIKDIETHFAGHGVECADDSSLRNPLGKLLRSGQCVGNN